MMKTVKRTFGEGRYILELIGRALGSCDLDTGFALRRSRRRLSQAAQDMQDQAKSEDDSPLEAYSRVLADTLDPEKAAEAHPEGREPYLALVTSEITFEVLTVNGVLDKPWPHRDTKDDKPLTQDEWVDLLEALDMVGD